jgi:hypothetical protein
MKKILITYFFLFFVTVINSQNKKKDISAIKSMCGCFEIEFNFSETFSYTEAKPSNIYKSKALEYAELIYEDNNTISIQHLLIVGSEKFPSIIKHWRQDWLYQNTDLYKYDVNNSWNFVKMNKKDVRNQWTQKVFQVDDSPRYEGSSSWVHVDGKSYWENITPAPLPRREYTKRSDYNITLRGNRHEITNYGWLHDQDNQKINIDKNGKNVVVALEKGLNFYKRVDDEKCLPAKKWWQKNKNKWEIVRSKWSDVYSKNKKLTLKDNFNDKKLYQYLFMENYNDQKTINPIIEKFIKY